jgi:hypothetical protein
MRDLNELMEAINLSEVYRTVQYLDKLGYATKDIDIDELKCIASDVHAIMKSRGLQ